MEYETHEDVLLFDLSSSNPSLDHRRRHAAQGPAPRWGGFKPQKGERIPEEDDQLA
ncbi:hypothetical protein [Croceibacterium aestuarii]|uniref:hypothetical protein n=1 Tax=Croceibacterium aestuarii TaxID=3064139 RepID=UPI00272E68E3|nr:hypothetical protein [Croceibacterium sp. D39]